MDWWIWALAGIILAGVEVVTPGFFIIFFSAGALAAAGMAFVWPTSPLSGQVLVFSFVSAFSMIFFRKPMMRRFGLDKGVASRDEIVEESATPIEDIPAGGAGKAELRGTVWNARNGGGTSLAKGQRCKVERVDGLTLWLKPE